MNRPLVCVVVVSYNSSETIVETLESIYRQDYQRLELIISDDCSKDNSVVIAQEWVSKKSPRFVKVQIIQSSVNTGVSPNCNRALKKVNGDWIKYIAADDILEECAISNYVNFSNEEKYAKIIFGDIVEFKKTQSNIENGKVKKCYYNSFHGKKITARIQYQYLINFYNLPAPSSFINKDKLLQLGGFDENYPMIEDAPLWLKFTKNDIKIFCLQKVTVFYRVHDKSLTREKPSNVYLSKDLMVRIENFTRSEKLQEMSIIWRAITEMNFFIQRLVIKYFNRRVGYFSRVIYLLWKVTNPGIIGNLYFRIKEKIIG